jgi:hypothetical protein
MLFLGLLFLLEDAFIKNLIKCLDVFFNHAGFMMPVSWHGMLAQHANTKVVILFLVLCNAGLVIYTKWW